MGDKCLYFVFVLNLLGFFLMIIPLVYKGFLNLGALGLGMVFLATVLTPFIEK